MRRSSLKVLIAVCWALWSLLLLGGLVAAFLLVTERSTSPEMSGVVGTIVAGGLLFVLAASGGILYWFTVRQSVPGLIAVACGLGFVVTVAATQPALEAYRRWTLTRHEADIGDFEDPDAAVLAKAILENDPEALRRSLGDGKPPVTLDRAGQDLVALAVFALCERGGGLEPLRILLEAGAAPGSSRLGGGRPPLHFLVLDSYRTPQALAAIELLLEHGAPVDAIDTFTGETALRLAGSQPELVRLFAERGADLDSIDEYGQSQLVRFIAEQQWESALVLVEKGARLDTVSPSGISVDYYVETWKDDVYGDQPEGWDRLRAAIAERREREATSR